MIKPFTNISYGRWNVWQDTLTLRHPSDVITGDDQSRAADKQAPAIVTEGESACPYADCTYGNFAPARQVHLFDLRTFL